MKNKEKRKENFNNFSWKIVNILKTPQKELSKEEKSLYNNWIEDIEDYGFIVVHQNKILEINRGKENYKLMTVGIFNEEKLLSGIELVLGFDDKKLKSYKSSLYYSKKKIESEINHSLEKIFEDNKDSIKVFKNPYSFAYQLMESDNKQVDYLNINKINEETGKNIKDYLTSKKSL
jgi:hypothetical protein